MASKNSFLIILCVLSLISGCVSLPTIENHQHRQMAIVDTDSTTRLGKALKAETDEHPGKSGVTLLQNPRDAFVARLMLTELSESSIDLQYYIWWDDISGTILYDALIRAANRDVRIRLLLDDNNTRELDSKLWMLNEHPNIYVRLFNPNQYRNHRLWGLFTNFARLNKRMHNKSFTIDNQATIVGGRNIGDEYFEVNDDFLFQDLDVLAVGKVVEDVSNDFDLYWNSAYAYPLESLIKKKHVSVEKLTQKSAALTTDNKAEAYITSLRESSLAQEMMNRELELIWCDVTLISDSPRKVGKRSERKDLITFQLTELIGSPEKELVLVSPYFVPGRNGTNFLIDLAESGINITVLTNSFEATDVMAVHSGYVKRRKKLLKAGIKLYELKRESGTIPMEEERGFTSSKASSLHAKTFVVDHDRVFVGSFNFDQRSFFLNTEMGFLIEHEELTGFISDTIQNQSGYRAYEVRLTPKNNLHWIQRSSDSYKVITKEPGIGFWNNVGLKILHLLPIEWML